MPNVDQSVRDALMEALALALKDANVASGNVYRSREIPLRKEIVPAVIVRPTSETVEAFSEDEDRNRLIVAVEVHVRGDPFDEVADPVAVTAHLAIVRAPALREIAASVRRRSTNWLANDGDETAGVVLMQYQFTYLTGADDIAALA